MLQTSLQEIAVVLCKKATQKNRDYSKSETFLKIGKNGHQAIAIAFAKSSLWDKN